MAVDPTTKWRDLEAGNFLYRDGDKDGPEWFLLANDDGVLLWLDMHDGRMRKSDNSRTNLTIGHEWVISGEFPA